MTFVEEKKSKKDKKDKKDKPEAVVNGSTVVGDVIEPEKTAPKIDTSR